MTLASMCWHVMRLPRKDLRLSSCHSWLAPLCALVGQAIDQTAIETLAAVLPAIGKQDLPLLDDPAFTDCLGTNVSYQRHFYGDEAFGI